MLLNSLLRRRLTYIVVVVVVVEHLFYIDLFTYASNKYTFKLYKENKSKSMDMRLRPGMVVQPFSKEGNFQI